MAKKSTAKRTATKRTATKKKVAQNKIEPDSVSIDTSSIEEIGYAVESVFVSVGKKINMGNYESLDLNAGQTLRCKSDLNMSKEERDEARQKIFEEAWSTSIAEINKVANKVTKRT